MVSGPFTAPISPPEQGTGTGKTIALVANQCWSIYHFRLPLIRALQAEGYRIAVLAPLDESVSLLLQEPGVEVYALRHFQRNSTGLVRNIRLLLELYRQFSAIQPNQVVHFGIQANVFGNIAARWTGTASICVVTGLGYTFLHRGFIPWIAKQLYRISLKSARKVVFENKEDLDLMVRERLTAPAKSMHVPGCGIDVQHYAPDGTAPEPGRMVFTYLGRLLYDKGLREFAAAAAMLRKERPYAECWILGQLDDGNPAHIDRRELLQWVQTGAIVYKGSVRDVRPFIRKSNWIVQPSYREGLSRTLLEAMSMGKPVIATDTAGCREMVDPGKSGYLVPVKNTQALFEAMLHACDVPAETAIAMGSKGREKIKANYTDQMVGQFYLTLLK
ncbi:MAG: glycosyltransferase family 4 protein [Lewinellaceae bacterium]|nr:glycosyltransferase family 4 protein [Lewinellaceae bacterium]